MSDNARRFRSILKSLKKLYPKEPKGNLVRNLVTLAFMISGILGGKSCQLPQISSKVADGRKPESRVKSFSRWLQNIHIDFDIFYLPYATTLLDNLSHQTLAIVFDASAVGRDCMSLIASVIYKNRALPICWITRHGQKGHFAEDIHLELLNRVIDIVPKHATVVFLGDGEFDGLCLIKTIIENNWHFVSRTAKNRILFENDECFSFQNIGVNKEDYFLIPNVTLAKENSPQLNAVLWWEPKYQEPIYLLTNIELAKETLYWYKKRFKIETMFSDQKSRGFNIHKSHISDPERINRLLMAAFLAYILIIYLGVFATKNELHKIIHRTDRCDLSLTQLGFRLLEYFLNMRRIPPAMVQLTLFKEI
jgi:hypothetical protein